MKQIRIVHGAAVLLFLLVLIQGVQAVTYEPGFSASYYKGQNWDNLMGSRYDNQIHFADALAVSGYGWVSDEANWPIAMVGQDNDFSVAWDGYISVTSADTYTFFLTSDDGSNLWIDDNLVIDNSGLHSPLTKSGAVPLSAGYHHVVVKMFEQGSTSGNIAVAYLEYESEDVTRQLVTGYHEVIPAPEFPSAFLPATFIIGMLGAVLLVSRMKEN